MPRRIIPYLCFALPLLAIACPLVRAQTRSEVIAEEQAAKAKVVHPYEPTTAERVFLTAKKEFFETPAGWYPTAGSIYRGTGLGLGAGYRHYLRDQTYLDVKGLISFGNSQLAQAALHSGKHEKFDFDAVVSFRNVRRLAFYGVGLQSTAQSVQLPFTSESVDTGAAVRPFGPVVLQARAGVERYELTPPSPNSERNPQYVRYTSAAGIDSRPAAGYARRGGLYEVRYHRYTGLSSTTGFDRAQAEVVQHVPFFRENWVVSAHGLIDSVINHANAVPYVLMPALGGTNSLRGYSSWRFRDSHALLLQGEVRWVPNRFAMDMALFFDAGKVVNRRAALNLTGLKKDIGVEVRFHGPAQTPLRIGVARGSEGWNLLMAATASF